MGVTDEGLFYGYFCFANLYPKEKMEMSCATWSKVANIDGHDGKDSEVVCCWNAF
jgi:hypothetical protein